MEKIIANFAFKNSTKGAHRYEEIDKNGNALVADKGTVNTLYIRKVKMVVAPTMLVVTIEQLELGP